ncbi:MAG: 3-dehydroquinate synthase [Gemmatimonadaceae bacterium]
MSTLVAHAPASSPTRAVDAGSYRVIIGAGLRRAFASWIVDAAPAHRFAVVSDADVAPLYADALVSDLGRHARTSLHLMPAGEAHKTRETWARLTDDLLAAGCGRDTTIVALGGGVVGDLAGFVAATFMRGVPVVQCPTSLLAMIDASVGGKTGVDTPAGKNLVGAFHPPAVVLADVEILGTLPRSHRRAGLAEAIKHGVIADAAYFARIDESLHALLEGDADATLALVARSVELKAEVVRADEHEHGIRKTLNFGHTLGHAIELTSGFTLLHGEAIAIGMVLEARLAERIGVAPRGTSSEIERLTARAGLPVARPAAMSVESVLEATRLDKKARGGAVAYSLPARIGAMAGAERGWAIEVGDALVREVLA